MTSDEEKTNIEKTATEDAADVPSPPDDTPPLQPLPKKTTRERISGIYSGIMERIRSLKPASDGRGRGGRKLSRFEPIVLAEWAQRALQKQGIGFYGALATLLICTYFIADLTALFVGKFIPEPPTARVGRTKEVQQSTRNMDEYNIIFSRNLFSSERIIPGDETSVGPTLPQDPGGSPVKTSLPFNLIGTIILRDELRSIATIEDKSASTVYPVRQQDEIPQKARILKIEPRRVIFVNVSSNQREFIELPEDLNTTNPRIVINRPQGPSGIEKVAPTQFNISRSEVDRSLADLNNILTQARAVPNMENGRPAGYRLFQIVPGSIYDKLGLQNNDVIAGVNGQPINDPGKAFELLSELKNSSQLELQIKRDGKSMPFSYEIR